MTLEQQMLAEFEGHFWSLDYAAGRTVDLNLATDRPTPTPRKYVNPPRRKPPEGDTCSKMSEARLLKIFRIIAVVTGIPRNVMAGPSCKIEVARARHLFSWAADEFTDFSAHRIAKVVNRDYSTIQNAIERVWADKKLYEPHLSKAWCLLSKAFPYKAGKE